MSSNKVLGFFVLELAFISKYIFHNYSIFSVLDVVANCEKIKSFITTHCFKIVSPKSNNRPN